MVYPLFNHAAQPKVVTSIFYDLFPISVKAPETRLFSGYTKFYDMHYDGYRRYNFFLQSYKYQHLKKDNFWQTFLPVVVLLYIIKAY